MERKITLTLGILVIASLVLPWQMEPGHIRWERIDAYVDAAKEFDRASAVLAIVGLSDRTERKQKEIAAAATHLLWRKAHGLYLELTEEERDRWAPQMSAALTPVDDMRETYLTIKGMTDDQILVEYERMRILLQSELERLQRQNVAPTPTRKAV